MCVVLWLVFVPRGLLGVCWSVFDLVGGCVLFVVFVWLLCLFLVVVRCVLFVVYCFAVNRLLFVVACCRSLCFVWWPLLVVCCYWLVVCGVMFGVRRCLLFGVRSLFIVPCLMMVVVCSLLCIVR